MVIFETALGVFLLGWWLVWYIKVPMREVLDDPNSKPSQKAKLLVLMGSIGLLPGLLLWQGVKELLEALW